MIYANSCQSVVSEIETGAEKYELALDVKIWDDHCYTGPEFRHENRYLI